MIILFFSLKLAEYPKPLFESKASKWLVCYTAVFSVTKKRLCIADYQITNERSLVTGKLSRRRDNARTHCETDRELRLISLYRSIISPWKTKILPNIKILTKHLIKIKKKKKFWWNTTELWASMTFEWPTKTTFSTTEGFPKNATEVAGTNMKNDLLSSL